MSKAIAHPRYRQLVVNILDLYRKAKASLARFYWETGRRIVEVEQDGEAKAVHGSGLLARLSAELTRKCGPGAGFSVENLRRMRHFYLTHSNQSVPTDLTWNQYVALLPVKDARRRSQLERRVAKDGLGSREIRRLVREANSDGDRPLAAGARKLPALKRPAAAELKPRTYRKAGGKTASLFPVKEGRVLLDCGFFVCQEVTQDEAAAVAVTDKPSYTYGAKVERVVDADTLLVVVDLGFGVFVREKLRLKGIDAPEAGTPDGEKAGKHVAGLLAAGSPIVLKSHRTDIYGRFVADVFYQEGVAGPAVEPEAIISDGVYLNQRLLDAGFAAMVKDSANK